MPERRSGTSVTSSEQPATASGPGRVLNEAPVPYALSALAAVVYVLATVALARRGVTWWRVAMAACTFEMVGVLVIGTVSLALPDAFPDATVWSNYGMGYLFIPLVLPVFGLLWLRRTAPRRR